MNKVGIYKFAKDEGGREIEGSRKLLALADFDSPKYADWFCRTLLCCSEIDEKDLRVFGNIREARVVEDFECEGFVPGGELVWYMLGRGMRKLTASAVLDEARSLLEIIHFVDHVQDHEEVRPRVDERDLALECYERWYY